MNSDRRGSAYRLMRYPLPADLTLRVPRTPHFILVALLLSVQLWASMARLQGICVANATPVAPEAMTPHGDECCRSGNSCSSQAIPAVPKQTHDHGPLPSPANHPEGPCCSHLSMDETAAPSGARITMPDAARVVLAFNAPEASWLTTSRVPDAPVRPSAPPRPPPDQSVVKLTILRV